MQAMTSGPTERATPEAWYQRGTTLGGVLIVLGALVMGLRYAVAQALGTETSWTTTGPEDAVFRTLLTMTSIVTITGCHIANGARRMAPIAMGTTGQATFPLLTALTGLTVGGTLVYLLTVNALLHVLAIQAALYVTSAREARSTVRWAIATGVAAAAATVCALLL